MNKYLLLRDNKQTGPYTVEELVQKGLKPYDLVWLDGRSAAWRYPSEIDELRPYAPVVEEQPYDRFYKRSSSTQEHAVHAAQHQLGREEQSSQSVEHKTHVPFTTVQPVQQTAVAAQAAAMPTATVPDQEETPVVQLPQPGSGKVYVTLPAGFRPKTTAQVVETKSGQPTGETRFEQPAGDTKSEKPKVDLKPVQMHEETIPVADADGTAVSEEAAKALEARAESLARSVQKAAEEAAAKKLAASKALEEKYGPKPADAANRQTTHNETVKPVSQPAQFSQLINSDHLQETVPVIPLHNSARKQRLLMRSIVAVCLLLGGIVIGMALTYSKSSSDSQQALDQLVQRLQEREAQRLSDARQTPVAEETAQPPSGNIADEETPPRNDDHSMTQPVRSTELAVRDKESPPPVEEKEPAISYQEKQPATMKVTPAVITEKEEPRPVRQAELSAAREKIYQMVQVAASPFQTGVLGGISNLYFTISNTSSFPLDQIELEVKYLGPEKRVVKVQRLIFNDIAANGQKTLEAPRTSRGVSIDYAVTKINSRALGIARAGF